MTRFGWSIIVAGYLLMVCAVVAGIFAYRTHVLATLDTPEAREEWQQWRADAEQQSQAGPVRRRVPKSAEPPGLVLVRDSFPALVGGGIFFSSVLYVLMVWILRGAFQSGKPGPH